MANISPYRGFSGVGRLRNEIDRLFEDVARGGDEPVSRSWTPRADISETDDKYIIRMDAPGLSKDDLHIEMREGQIMVRGERRSEHQEESESMRRVERSYGQFYRSFTLPKAGDSENVAANLQNGVLKISIPKREESKPRRIELS